MARLQNLCSDIWFIIAEQLSLGDLSIICEAFTGLGLDTDIRVISTRQATRILCQLLTSNLNKAEIGLESVEELWNQSLISRFDYKYGGQVRGKPILVTSLTRMQNTSQSYIPIFKLEVKMPLSLTNFKPCSDFFSPKHRGCQPAEPIIARIQLLSKVSSSHAGLLELRYCRGANAPTSIVKDEQNKPELLTRTIGQELQLVQALWQWTEPNLKRRSFGKPVVVGQQYELPRRWFEFLGDKVYVEVEFDIISRSSPPTPDYWDRCPCFLRRRSISFEHLVLPNSQSL